MVWQVLISTRISYDASLNEIRVVIMPSTIHESVPGWLSREVSYWVLSGTLSAQLLDLLEILPSPGITPYSPLWWLSNADCIYLRNSYVHRRAFKLSEGSGHDVMAWRSELAVRGLRGWIWRNLAAPCQRSGTLVNWVRIPGQHHYTCENIPAFGRTTN